jgi:heme-degrading monooxygenase HmoA
MKAEPGCFAVIFKSKRTAEAGADYDAMNAKLFEMAKSQPGYLGIDSVRGADGTGLSVSYWRSREDIANWKRNMQHAAARKLGREKWYESYEVNIARVEEPTGDV